jgi:serine/threonine protein kinase
MTGEFASRGSGADFQPPGPGIGANLVGVALLGRYQVLERIGDGGMGTVYMAEHTTILKKFAVKVLSAELSLRAEHCDRFMREARSASMINHPNVVEITDFGKTPGRPALLRDGVPAGQGPLADRRRGRARCRGSGSAASSCRCATPCRPPTTRASSTAT